MKTARKAQGTLTKLISAISNYDLTSDEKNYLHSLAKDNDLMTDELKSELPHFFNRIFVDFDQEFHEWAQTIIESAVRPQAPAIIPADPSVPDPQRKRALHQPAYSLPIKPAITSTSTSTPTPARRTINVTPPAVLAAPQAHMAMVHPVAGIAYPQIDQYRIPPNRSIAHLQIACNLAWTMRPTNPQPH